MLASHELWIHQKYVGLYICYTKYAKGRSLGYGYTAVQYSILSQIIYFHCSKCQLANIYKCQCSFPDDIPHVPNHAIHMASRINPIFATSCFFSPFLFDRRLSIFVPKGMTAAVILV